ncbi:hypothetical protein [Rhodoplanes serenus]|uniref:hypothetical protein n=1 Tax=Rhodoplanes serenus TaxID=200615 RepID=UPI0011B94100|nr:hypothetical protein [Rhodoplanes serenus]
MMGWINNSPHSGRVGRVTGRRGERRPTEPRGYAALPGTGPAGETCGACRHIVRGRRWRKCELARALWTHGPGTDIRAGAPACRQWEA